MELINHNDHNNQHSNAKLETTNKLIKQQAFAPKNFKIFKDKIFITLTIKKERDLLILSRIFV